MRVQTVICGCFADWGAKKLDFSLRISTKTQKISEKLRKISKNREK